MFCVGRSRRSVCIQTMGQGWISSSLLRNQLAVTPPCTSFDRRVLRALCSRCIKARVPKVEPPNRAASSALSSRRLISTNTNGVGNRCNLTDTTWPVSEHLCAIDCRRLRSVSFGFTGNITFSVSPRFAQTRECALSLPLSMIQNDQCSGFAFIRVMKSAQFVHH